MRAMKKNSSWQAVILAGGAGTRLRPLTLNIPKPMIEVNGRPFLHHIIRELEKQGIKNLVLCVGYLADKIKGYFGCGSKFGVSIKYSVEDEYLGTAGALKHAEHLLKDDFFVLNGDTYLSADYRDIFNKFKKADKIGTMVVYDNRENIAEENIELDDQGIIVDYGKKEPLKKGDQLIERKTGPKRYHKYIDAGVYVFKNELLGLIEGDKFVSLEGDIYPELIKSKQLKAYITSRRYYDLGTPERLDLIRRVLK